MRGTLIFIALLLCKIAAFSQGLQKDSIFLLNGNIFAARVNDTLQTIHVTDSAGVELSYEVDQLYKIRFSSGTERFYYFQDSAAGNWLSREEMRMYMKGEADARKGFKAKGATVGSAIAGLLGGMTGTFWGPLAPYGFMALTFIPKVRIRHSTVSNLNYLKSDAYLMGYERVARQKMKIRSLIGGSAGLIAGYIIYFAAHESYPQQVNFGLK